MVWVLSLSRTDIITRTLSPWLTLRAFGVWLGVVGFEAP
jgi:hypothetical protein